MDTRGRGQNKFRDVRLIKTMLSKRPRNNAFYLTAFAVVLMLLTTLVFWRSPETIAELLPISREKFFGDRNYWRAFTAIFVHSDLEHLLSNVVLLVPFSFFVGGYFGPLLFPIVALVLASVVNVLAVASYPAQTELIGASGLVYLLGGLWLTLYFFIQRQYRVSNRLLRVAGIAMVLFLPSTFVPTTSYRTHAIGFAVGIITGIWFFLLNKNQIRSYEVYTEPEEVSFV